MRSRIGVVAVAALLAIACAPETDRTRYQVGDTGVATLANQLTRTLYLGGCNHFEQEELVGDAWMPRDGDVACVWEGFAQPVPPGTAVDDVFRARAPGTWRLRYVVGAGCSDSAPLSPDHCAIVHEVTSNEFEVVAPGCVVTGCSGHVCAEDHVMTTCEWQPQYACYRSARCGRFGAGGTCAWEDTPELRACLDETAGDPGGPVLFTPR